MCIKSIEIPENALFFLLMNACVFGEKGVVLHEIVLHDGKFSLRRSIGIGSRGFANQQVNFKTPKFGYWKHPKFMNGIRCVLEPEIHRKNRRKMLKKICGWGGVDPSTLLPESPNFKQKTPKISIFLSIWVKSCLKKSISGQNSIQNFCPQNPIIPTLSLSHPQIPTQI